MFYSGLWHAGAGCDLFQRGCVLNIYKKILYTRQKIDYTYTVL